MTLAARIRRLPAVLWVFIVGAALIAAIVLLKPNPQPRAPKPIAQTQVKVVLAQPQAMAVNVNAQGSVEPRRQIDVVSQVAGSLVQVSEQFASGGFFAKGATLVQIDPRDYEIALVRAKAALLDAEKLLATERGQAQQAQRQWQELGSKDANELFLRKPQLAAAEAQVAAARAGVQQAQLNLERTRIQLPFAARVNNTWVDLGQFVSTGTRIATVYDSAVALVRLPLTDLQASLINLPLAFGKPQQELPDVILRGVVAGNAYEWKGKITRTEASLDPQSRMFYAVVEIPDPFDPVKNAVPLLMGMYVNAEIIGKPIANVMRLPKSVIFRRDQVYSLDTDNRVQIHSVKILRSDEQHVWFTGDIKSEQAIVLERQGYLTAGTQVVPEVVTNLAAEATQP